MDKVKIKELSESALTHIANNHHGVAYGEVKAILALLKDKPCETKPDIVCLCGSTRFYEQFMEANYKFTMEGKIVLSVGFFMHRSDTQHGQIVGCTPKQKIELDKLHLRKIDLADSVFVLNVNGYIGESTRREIEYAESKSKPIGYLESCEAAEDDELQNKSITDTKLKCPKCGWVCKVADAICDGQKLESGYVFESDGSLGCPNCFGADEKSVYMLDYQPAELDTLKEKMKEALDELEDK